MKKNLKRDSPPEIKQLYTISDFHFAHQSPITTIFMLYYLPSLICGTQSTGGTFKCKYF